MPRIRPETPFRTLLFLACVTLSVYFVFSIGSRTMQIYQLRQEENRLTDEVKTQQARNQQLAKEREGLQHDADIEKVAREELNLIKPGETAIIVLPSNEVITRLQEEQTQAQSAASAPQPRSFWERLFSR